jgi:hypothetical protein
MLWKLKNEYCWRRYWYCVNNAKENTDIAYCPSVEVCLVTRKILRILVLRKADAHTGPTQRATLVARARVHSPAVSLYASTIWNFLNGSDNRVTGWS